MLNQWNGIGRLGRDPESRFTQDGTEVVNFSIACTKKFKGRDGQMQEKTEWVRIVVWGKQASFCSKYLSKGGLVFVSGELETRKWQDQNGQERYTTEIKAERVQAMDKRPDGQPQSTGQPAAPYNATDEMDSAPF